MVINHCSLQIQDEFMIFDYIYPLTEGMEILKENWNFFVENITSRALIIRATPNLSGFLGD